MQKTDNPMADRVASFCNTYGMDIPVLMAPMAGACPPQLASAVCNAGGMGACGALLMDAETIENWVSDVRSSTNGAFQINTWVPDPAPLRNKEHELELRMFLEQWGPAVSESAADAQPIDFDMQCEAMLAAGPRVISSIMGLYPEEFVKKMKANNIHWFATATTVTEALAAEAAGADVIVAQGMEAGGHRGAFDADAAHANLVGLFSLLPAIVDSVNVPVVATGGIADARAVAAAIILGASAVQIGTGLLRSTQANTPAVLADAMALSRPEHTVATRAFSGRLGRSLKTAYTDAASDGRNPAPAPFPIQRNLTAPMRTEASKSQNIEAMQAWAGQSAGLAQSGSAADIVAGLWGEARGLLAV